jgi:hypothetical protein
LRESVEKVGWVEWVDQVGGRVEPPSAQPVQPVNPYNRSTFAEGLTAP